MNVIQKVRNLDRKQKAQIIRYAGHVAAWLPLIVLVYDWWFYRLGIEPIREITLRTGKWTLILLLSSLAITPIKLVTGWNQLHSLRRIFGVYAFMYVCLHLGNFAIVDYNFDLRLVVEEIILRRYALVGFAAFLILLPLALTSTKGWMKRLGKRWTTLHKLIYPAAVLVIIHFIWLVKSDIREPLMFGAGVAALLLLRRPAVRKKFVELRQRIIRRRRAMPRAVRGAPDEANSLP